MGQPNLFGELPPPEVEYPLKGEGSITASALKKAEPELQKEVMQVWFYGRFEDPAESCPYDGREGGYQFIYGGPYDAGEQLQNQFGDIVPYEVIEELTIELQNECWQWSGDSSVSPDDPTEWDYEPAAEVPKHLQTFDDSIAGVEGLLAVEVPAALRRRFDGMLYVSVITALEAYLLDNFISCLNADPALFRKYIETTDHFQTKKIPLSHIFKESEGIEKRGRAYLTKMVWHRLSEVAKLYRNTLGVRFPQDMTALVQAVQVRHDFAHRNGRTPDGVEITLTHDQVTALIKLVRDLVVEVETQQSLINGQPEAESVSI